MWPYFTLHFLALYMSHRREEQYREEGDAADDGDDRDRENDNDGRRDNDEADYNDASGVLMSGSNIAQSNVRGGNGNGWGSPADGDNSYMSESSALVNDASESSHAFFNQHLAMQNNGVPMVKIDSRFLLVRRIGGGAFGEVFEALDTYTQESVAVKLEPIKSAHSPHLHHEARLYSYLSRDVVTVGIPRLWWFGPQGDYNVMVMDLLGPSIEALFEFCGRSFDFKTVYMIVEQMIHRLEFMHSMGYLHRDIKPDNFVMGLGRRAHHVYVVDLGLAKRFWDSKAQRHIPFVSGKNLTGTARYVSLSTHLGHQQGRKDDLESVAYVALYLAKGTVPWQGLRCHTKEEKYDKIKKCKQNTTIPKLCEGLPPVFQDYLAYCRSLQFEQKPDYKYCRELFANAIAELGVRDYDYSWLSKRRIGSDESGSNFSGTSGGAAGAHQGHVLSRASSAL